MKGSLSVFPQPAFVFLIASLVCHTVLCGGFQGWEFTSHHPNEMFGVSASSVNGSIYILGDSDNSEYVENLPFFDRLWILDANTLDWSWKITSGDIPVRRRDYCTTIVNNKLYLFGGRLAKLFQKTNMLHSLDLNTYRWVNETRMHENYPPARESMSCNAYMSSVIIYGGEMVDSMDRLWIFDTVSKRWDVVIPTPEEYYYVPFAVNQYPHVYLDCLMMFGGVPDQNNGTYYNYYTEYPFLNIFNITELKWKESVVLPIEAPIPAFATSSIFENKMVIFGGWLNNTFEDMTNSIIIIRLDTFEFEVLMDEKSDYQTNFPISMPSGRIFSTASTFGGYFFVIGGGYYSCSHNDVWVFDLEKYEWTVSSLSKYPLGRDNPHVTPISENKVAVFGGDICYDGFQPINDLWTLDTDNFKWERIVQESVCHPDASSCAPSVQNATLGYFNGSLFLVGGKYENYDKPIYRRFSFDTMEWSIFEPSGGISEIGLRYKSANIVLENKLYIWGGANSDSTTIDDDDVFAFDMKSLDVTSYAASSPFLLYESVKGITIENNFCISNLNVTELEGMRGIWCLDEKARTWDLYTNFTQRLPRTRMFDYSSNVLFVGKDNAQGLSSFWRLIDPNKQYWEEIQIEKQIAPRRQDGGMFIQSNKIILFGGGVGNDQFVNGMYSLDLARFWCDGTQTVTSRNHTLGDGSGNYLYFPGTDCHWKISETNFIVVDYVDVTAGANLILYVEKKCDEDIEFRYEKYRKISLLSVKQGEVISIPSGKTTLSFQVDKHAKASDGFSLRLFYCKAGFVFRNEECICESGKFINFRGECIPCFEGSMQPYENQYECISSESTEETKAEKFTSTLGQSDSMEISNGIPPMVYASSAVIESEIFLVGGSTSADTSEIEHYHSLDEVYRASSAVNTIWEKIKAKGDIPSRRVQSCFISMGRFGVLIGGKTHEYDDDYVYFFEAQTMEWTRKSKAPRKFIGAQCQRRDDTIYILGGENEHGELIQSVFIYTPSTDVWKEIILSDTNTRSFGLMVLYDKSIIVFGGKDKEGEPEALLVYNLDFALERRIDVQTDDCASCEEEGGICMFGRQRFSHAIHDNQLHIYGGIRRASALSENIIIDLDSFQVVYRRNYGLSLPDLPLSVPPPKFGASFVSSGTTLMMIGGATSVGNVGNDVWVWDTELRLWVDSSILREPISRKEPGICKFGDDSLVVFGGSTEYIDEALLNDLWIFDTKNRKWDLLFGGSMDEGPSPRAGGMIAAHSTDIYVTGGRTDVKVEDDRLWVFYVDLKRWSVLNTNNQLSSFQRPLNRYGIRSTQVGDTMWMWGGQRMPGSRKVEFYSAVIGINPRTQTSFSHKATTKTPSRRTYHSLCAVDKNTISLYGGYNTNTKAMNDHWIYNMQNQTWEEANYRSSDKHPLLSNHFCGDYGGNTILGGLDESISESGLWMMQHDFKRQAKMHKSNHIKGYESISNGGGLMIDGLAVMFGGSNGHSITNQVIAYKPGFCSSKAQHMESGFRSSAFDDGSGEGMYLEGSNCTWILPNATHIMVSKKVRTQDRVEIISFESGNSIEETPVSTRESLNRESVYHSESGFIIRFVSSITEDKSANKPCSGCEGFRVVHAGCPVDSYFDAKTTTCTCIEGYSLSNEKCNKDTKSKNSATLSIIGGGVGGVFVVVFVGILIYRKRMTEKMKGTEKKLYAIIDPSELSYGRLLGSGSFGEVYKGEWRGTEVAIKVLVQKKLDKAQIEAFLREISIMVELRHPNIVLYMGACFENGDLRLVCELMHQGSLYDVLHHEKSIPLLQRVQFMSDIAKGMQYLHMSNPPIIHRDLKSLNILVDDRSRLKVSDFGLTAAQGADNKEEVNGSLLWLAPEVIGGGEYTACADVYSFGVICWEIVSRKDPFYEIENVFAVTAQVLINELRPTMPGNVPEDIQSLIRELWAQSPQDRPTFQEASRRISNITESSKHSSKSSFNAVMDYEENTPPDGNVCVVCTRVYGSDALWEDIPDSMADALITMNESVKHSIKKHRGYINQNDGENYVVVFCEGFDGIKFCTDVQTALNNLNWSAEVQNHECSKSDADGDFRGLRVKMGVDFGACESKAEDEASKKLFSGRTISEAMRISRMCHGGQIIITEATYQSMDEKIRLVESESVIKAIHQNSSRNESTGLYEITPKSLEKRLGYFARLQHQATSTHDMNETNINSPQNGQLPNTPMQSHGSDSKQEGGIQIANAGKKIDNHGPANTGKVRLEPLPQNIREKKDWEIDLSEITTDSKSIGSGSFGSVFVGEYKGRKVAVKKTIRSAKMTIDETFILFFSEVSIYRKLKHRNIVEFIGAHMELPNLAIIMEYVEPGNLRQLLQDHTITIGQNEKMKIINGIIGGMCYLHSMSPIIIHRDLKTANILVDRNFESKVCDFGFARIKANNKTMTKCGTVVYQAPEIMKGQKYTEKVDVYSFGIVLWEIETRETPFQGRNQMSLQFEVMKGLRPEIRSGMDKQLVSMMQKCWDANPDARPDFKDFVKEHNIDEVEAIQIS